MDVVHSRDGAWWIAATANFQVCSPVSRAHAEAAARRCEHVRAAITAAWCGPSADWRPRCQVVLHRTTREYEQAVGPGSGATLGSSLVSPPTGAVRSRRIDVRCDVVDFLTVALPHELCHVVLADHFRDRPAPLWFDEGVALQYDPAAKLRLHARDLRIGLAQGRDYSLPELVNLERYPAADRWGVLYGQSAALVQVLLMRGSPRQLLACVAQAPRGGMHVALAGEFGIRNWGDVRAHDVHVDDFSRGPRLQLVSFASTMAAASGKD